MIAKTEFGLRVQQHENPHLAGEGFLFLIKVRKDHEQVVCFADCLSRESGNFSTEKYTDSTCSWCF